MNYTLDCLSDRVSYSLCSSMWSQDKDLIEKPRSKKPTDKNIYMSSENSLRAAPESREIEDDIREGAMSCNSVAWELQQLQGRSYEDLDDVIERIVKKRDYLMQQNALALKEIKRLQLENTNLKNLNSIGKRLTKTQREELTNLKIQMAKDTKNHKEVVQALSEKKELVKHLEETVKQLKKRTRGAKNVLEDGLFWSSSHSAQEDDNERQPSNEASSTRNQGNDPLDAIFNWTVGF